MKTEMLAMSDREIGQSADWTATGLTSATRGKSMPATYRELFAVPEFRNLFAAHVASIFGSAFAGVAVMVLVFERTGSTALSAFAFSLAFLPHLCGWVLVPLVLYRVRPRRTMVLCDVVSGSVIGVMALPVVPVPVLLVMLFVVGTLSSIFSGVRAATLSEVLPDERLFVLGRAIIRLVAQGAVIAGSAVGAVLLAVFSAPAALLVDAVALLISATLIRFGTRNRPAPQAPVDDAGRAMRLHSAPFRHRQARRLLLFTWLMPACVIAPEALAVPYLHAIGQPIEQVGFLLAMMPLGLIVAELVVSRMFGGTGQVRFAAIGGWLAILALAAFVTSPSPAVAVVLLFAMGVGLASGAGVDRLMMTTVPEGIRTGALAYGGIGLMATQGLGIVVWGAVGEWLQVTIAIGLAAIAAAVVLILLKPRRGIAEVVAPGPDLPETASTRSG
ncbi:MFS transporter [Micromonospora sp. DT4]|uniref:MFS transporter n=1 Tax=Micromonospora sp. DT4 TaxID=3393438 RepID=UPI003CEDF3D0